MAQIPAYQFSEFFSRSIVKRTLLGLLVLLAAISACFGTKPLYRRIQINKTRETMSRIQSINNAWVQYCDGSGTFCPPSFGNSDHFWGNISPETMAELLRSRLKVDELELVFHDAWGHPLQFGVRCRKGHPDRFGIRAPGRDGKWDSDFYNAGPFGQMEFDRDLVKGSGQWITWPMSSSSGEDRIPIADPVHIGAVFPVADN